MGLVTSGAVVPYDVYTNYAFNLTRIYDDRVALMHPSVFLQRFARVWDGNAGRLRDFLAGRLDTLQGCRGAACGAAIPPAPEPG